MLAELSRVRIGDTEGSVLALTGRYGGFKWTPEPLSPREQWVDKEDYDYEVTRQCDYKYELGVSPFGTPVGRVGPWLRPCVLPERSFPHICNRY
jgi:hypothetical protein